MKKIKYLLLLLLLSPLGLLAQQISISGKVIDLTDGSTLPGVSVKIKGTTAGAVTDISGKFLIVVPNPDVVLQLSYIGYVTQEIAVKNIKDGVIALTATNKSLDEVVVVGYGVQKRATVTGSIATLQSKEIITTKNESVVNMLTGKIPGIRVVQTTAEPGSFANKLNIRGYQGLPPLVVIDGVIAGNDQAIIAKMDPNEIENMSVLKDAAASIYGMRAAGGAILVTTKKGGKNGKINVNYSVNNSIQTFLGMPEGVNAVDYMMLTNEKVKRDFANNFVANVTPQYSYADIQPYLNGTRKSADWSSLVFRKTANQIEHNLNIDGGNDKISYFFNFGYQKQDGVFKTGDLNYNKYNFRSNVTATITKGLKAQVLTSAYMDQKNQPYTDEWTVYKYTWNQIPIHQIYANDNPLYPAVMDDNMNPSIITDDSKVGFKTSKNKSITSQLNFTYDIPGIQGLTAKALFNVDYGVNDFNQIKRAYSLYTYSAADNTYIPSLVNSPSGITRAYYTHFNTLSQLTLSYLHTFGQDHNVNATIGYEQSHETADNFNAYRDIEIPVNYLFGGLQNSNMSGGMDAGALSDRAHRSIIGRANYDYKGKYLAEFSFRRDGNNLYKPGADQWGFFPGGSVGWVITKEKFFSNLVSDRILSNLKIRASYGQVGDESNAQAFNYVNGYTYPVNTYIFGASAVNGSAPKLGNPGLTWSVSTIKNIALDFGLFGGKIDGTVEVFRNDRTGLPATPAVALPGTVGADVPQINYNSDRVQGLDFSLSYRNTFGALGVNVTGNIGTTRLERIKVLEGGAGNEYLAWKNSQTNRYQNIWWGPEYAGQFTNYKQIYNYGINTGGGNNNVVPGDYYYKDWNNDGVIDDKDSHPIATNDIPLYNYGLNIGLSYKGFDMTLLLAGAAGVYVQYGEQFASPLMYGRSALTRFLDSWHTADPNANVFDPNTQWVPGFYPAMGSPDAQGTKAIQNASYLRIKTLEFGYSLSPATLKTIGIKKLRVYVNSYNLLTFTGLKNYDPEHQGPNPTDGGNFGVALGGYTYPMNRTFNVGANVSF